MRGILHPHKRITLTRRQRVPWQSGSNGNPSFDIRAHPGSLDSWRGVCSKSPEHDADHGEANECSDGCGVALKVAGQAAIATDPGKRPFDNPPFWQHLETGNVRSLDDLQTPGTGTPHGQRHLAPRVSAISKDAFDEREQSSRSTQQVESPITVLNISGMNDDVQQQAQCVDQDVPLSTFDLLARVVARRIEQSPPFCAPFAVCESMMAAVGLGSRPSCSRTATYSS